MKPSPSLGPALRVAGPACAALLALAGCVSTGPPKPLPLAPARKPAAPPDSRAARPGASAPATRPPSASQADAVPSPRAAVATPRPGPGTPPAGETDPLDELNSAFGWQDGVGDGRPMVVPLSLDYFQGLLVHVGVPVAALPQDGRALEPVQAVELLRHLLAAPLPLDRFGPARMAAHLLLEVAAGDEVVPRMELHERMRRFRRLRVLRPDGYLVKATRGTPLQKAGEVTVAGDGALRAGPFEVGPFYAVEGQHLFRVNQRLEVPPGASPTGIYAPDDGVLSPVVEGAALAVVDTVEGLYRLVFHTGETLEGLARLPGAVRTLYENAPEHWAAFNHKPFAERVRSLSRLTTSVLLVAGTSGAGAVKVASWGGKLGEVTVPLLSLAGDGALALRLVAVPAGTVVTATGQVVTATYVLHMASTGAQGVAGTGGAWTPPVGGPGRWVEASEYMSVESLKYQCQVSGAPPGWIYRVCRNGVCVDFDGYLPGEGFLLDAKAFNYAKHFDGELNPKRYYQGADKLAVAAERQILVAGGTSIRWHVAEEKMVRILKKLLQDKNITGIEVVYTPPLP